MKNILLTTLLISIVIFTSCKEKVTNPPDIPLPEGYQQDIPWPSLADSPWPINHGDPQSTGRSKFVGPLLGVLNKVVETLELNSGIVIGKDSSIFCSSSQLLQGGLYSFTSDYKLKWKLNTSESYETPIIAKDSTIYFMDVNSLFAVKSDGTIKWTYQIEPGNLQIRGLTIGLDGTLYFIDGNKSLNAINPNGSRNWSMTDNRFYPWGNNGLVFAPDGKTLYTTSHDNAVLAIDVINKSIKWIFTYKQVDLPVPPIVDCQGNIYINAKNEKNEIYFYSLKSDGTIRWQYQTNDTILYQPTIDKMGNLYLASSKLYSLDYTGNLRWKIDMGKPSGCALVCDAEGTVYAGVDSQTLEIYAIDSSGKIKWVLNDASYGALSGSPALMLHTLLQTSSNSANFFIIK